MENYIFHTLIAALLSYFIVSIFYREFTWALLMPPIDATRYRGKRALWLSISMLFLTSFVIIPTLNDRYEWFSFEMLAYGFLLGLPIALVFHRILSDIDSKNL